MSRFPSPESRDPSLIDPAEGHRLWAGTYDADLNPLLALERRVLQAHLDGLNRRRFVDVGCGTGRWLVFAREAGAEVFGFDLTHEMLKQAAVKPGLSGRLVRADAKNLPLRDAIADVTISSFCISYVEDLAAAFKTLSRITRPGGRIIVSDIHPTATSAGWKRTFRSGGQTYEMKLPPQGDRNPLQAALAVGLKLSCVLEPRFGEPERPLFEEAGKSDIYETVSTVPALHITVWDRPESG